MFPISTNCSIEYSPVTLGNGTRRENELGGSRGAAAATAPDGEEINWQKNGFNLNKTLCSVDVGIP